MDHNCNSRLRFSWIIVNEIGGCAYPNSLQELEYLKKIGIFHILCLDKHHYPQEAKSLGFEVKTIHIEEFQAPGMDVMVELHQHLQKIREKNEVVVIHCRMGWGRTGMVLAMYLMAFYNKSAKLAITEVRNLRPHSIETKPQEQALYVFEEYLQSFPT